MSHVKILWGIRIGSPDWQEEIVSIHSSTFDNARTWAEKNGFDRFRIADINTETAPDFQSALRINH